VKNLIAYRSKHVNEGANSMKYKIEIDRSGCIACGTCYSLNPSHFEPGDNMKSTVVNGETNDSGSSGVFDDDAIEDAREAEDSCPVSVITVTEV
jgi:ferredoxin